MESDIVTSECLLASTTELDSAVREFSADVELPAIKGLGALFKITEIFLTDEAAVDRLEEYSAFTQEQMPNIDLDNVNSGCIQKLVEAFYSLTLLIQEVLAVQKLH
eukprot:Gb_15868 [translate_table: standard]